MAMSNIAAALSTLLPTLNESFPPELIQLSTSLLAQSRARAATLKPEEEIARPYACAEIACKRLQVSLELPATTHGRAPCAPRVYKKLLGFLEGALAPARLPAKRKRDEGVVSKAEGAQVGISESTKPKKDSTGTRSTTRKSTAGSKADLFTPTTTPSKKHSFTGMVAKGTANSVQTVSSEAPAWIMPLIRRLCATFSTPLLPPHVYTGVCVALKLSALDPHDTAVDEEDASIRCQQIFALVISLYFTVLARMQKGKITSEIYMARSQRAAEIARSFAEAQGAGLTEPQVDLSKDDIDDWVKKIDEEGWARGQEWWESVPENVMDQEESNDVHGDITGQVDADNDDLVGRERKRMRKKLDERGREGDGGEDPEGVLLPGLGTMMQDAVDWLSEERRLDYLDWKENILKRIRDVEKGKGKAPGAVAVH